MCQREVEPQKPLPNIPRPGFIRKGCVRDGNLCPGCGAIHIYLRGEAYSKNKVDGYWRSYLNRTNGV